MPTGEEGATGSRGHEPADLAIDGRSQHELAVIGHQLVAEKFDRMQTESLTHDPLEGRVVLLVMKDRGPHVATIQGMVKPASFVSAWWSRHPVKSARPEGREKRPDPFFLSAYSSARITKVPGGDNVSETDTSVASDAIDPPPGTVVKGGKSAIFSKRPVAAL